MGIVEDSLDQGAFFGSAITEGILVGGRSRPPLGRQVAVLEGTPGLELGFLIVNAAIDYDRRAEIRSLLREVVS